MPCASAARHCRNWRASSSNGSYPVRPSSAPKGTALGTAATNAAIDATLPSIEDLFGEDIFADDRLISITSPSSQRPFPDIEKEAQQQMQAVAAEADAGLLDPLPPQLYHEAVHTTERIGAYMLGRTVGEGAFAKVKLATHMVTHVKVAIKIVLKKNITSEYVWATLFREGRLMRKFSHPNIVRLIEIIETEQAYCLVTEYAAGGELLVGAPRPPPHNTREYSFCTTTYKETEGRIESSLIPNWLRNRALGLACLLTSEIYACPVPTLPCSPPAYPCHICTRIACTGLHRGARQAGGEGRAQIHAAACQRCAAHSQLRRRAP